MPLDDTLRAAIRDGHLTSGTRQLVVHPSDFANLRSQFAAGFTFTEGDPLDWMATYHGITIHASTTVAPGQVYVVPHDAPLRTHTREYLRPSWWLEALGEVPDPPSVPLQLKLKTLWEILDEEDE